MSFAFKTFTAGKTYSFVYKAVNDNGASSASPDSADVLVSSQFTRLLYVSDHAKHRVLRFNTDGQFNMEFVRPGDGGLNRPWGIAQGPTGDVFVASGGTNNVLQYEQCTGSFVRVFCYTPGQPRGISFHTAPDGSGAQALYVASHFWDKVLVYDAANGGGLGSFSTVKSPWGLQWQTVPGSISQDLFVSSEDSIIRMNGSDGSFVSKYIDKQVNYAAGFVFDSSSQLFVTGPYAGNVIAVFSSSEEDQLAHFTKVYSDSYMKRCQGLQLHNATLYSACKNEIRSYDAETGEFLQVFADHPDLASTFLQFVWE